MKNERQISLTNFVGCGKIKPHLTAALCRFTINLHRTKGEDYEKNKDHLHHRSRQRK
jgi:hypothetical protein